MLSGQIKIFSVENTPRLRYIAGILLGDILGLHWEIINDKRKSGRHPVINYSSDNISGAFKIIPDKLLFEKEISPKEIMVSAWKGLPVFFQSTTGSDLPFDIFAASFFLVSRYEEYLEFSPDAHVRFPASSSLSFKNGFLDKPIIDLWARELAKELLKKIPSLVFRRNEFKSLLTIDTDEPFAFSEKNIFKSIEGLFHGKNKVQKNSPKNEKDPYDVFDYILKNIKENGIDVRFFFPVGDQSEFDKNPSWKSEGYRKLIKRIASYHSSGLHPSYLAGGDGSILKKEAGRLKTILEADIFSSRYHYLRLSMPSSYKNIITLGISEDYSMGYPDEPGFRAGIARPYCFYDLIQETQTVLKIIPFQIMDATLTGYKKLDPAGAKSSILNLINETKKVGGLFVSIWHNTSLLDDEEHKEWREVFEFMLKNQT